MIRRGEPEWAEEWERPRRADGPMPEGIGILPLLVVGAAAGAPIAYSMMSRDKGPSAAERAVVAAQADWQRTQAYVGRLIPAIEQKIHQMRRSNAALLSLRDSLRPGPDASAETNTLAEEVTEHAQRVADLMGAVQAEYEPLLLMYRGFRSFEDANTHPLKPPGNSTTWSGWVPPLFQAADAMASSALQEVADLEALRKQLQQRVFQAQEEAREAERAAEAQRVLESYEAEILARRAEIDREAWARAEQARAEAERRESIQRARQEEMDLWAEGLRERRRRQDAEFALWLEGQRRGYVPEEETPTEGMGNFQDLINKLPWRKDARESREARQDRRVERLDEQIAAETAALAQAAESQQGVVFGAGAVALGLLGLAYWWKKRK